jgi:uncharacterized damage-inducible protein DinB
MHHTMRHHANIGVLVPRDELAAAHAPRKHREDRAGHLFDGGVVVPGGDVHGRESTPAANFAVTRRLGSKPPAMKELLQRLVAHMRWADALVAEALAAPQPDAESVRLFAHIAAAEHLWHSRIQRIPPEHAVWPALSVTQAAALAERHAADFAVLLENANDTLLARIVEYRNSAGRDFRSSVSDIVVHVAMHGEHHRGQIARLVRASGREPPYTDYIQFTRRGQ